MAGLWTILISILPNNTIFEVQSSDVFGLNSKQLKI